jgi:hypothetical protein
MKFSGNTTKRGAKRGGVEIVVEIVTTNGRHGLTADKTAPGNGRFGAARQAEAGAGSAHPDDLRVDVVLGQ